MINYRGRLFDGRILFLAGALVICAISFMAEAAGAAQVRAEVNKEFAHILSVVQARRNPELTMVPTVGRGGLVTSPDRKYNAYVLCVPLPSPEDPERCAQRVHFEEGAGRTATIYQIRGEEELQEVMREIDRLKWVNNFTLSYERWAQPHFGHRYVIDVRSKKQIAAYDLFSR